jgi:hypothetical protein
VPLVIGRMSQDRDAIAREIRPLLGPRTLIVVSSDFTRFGPNYDFVPFKENIPARIEAMDDSACAAIRALSPQVSSRSAREPAPRSADVIQSAFCSPSSRAYRPASRTLGTLDLGTSWAISQTR